MFRFPMELPYMYNFNYLFLSICLIGFVMYHIWWYQYNYTNFNWLYKISQQFDFLLDFFKLFFHYFISWLTNLNTWCLQTLPCFHLYHSIIILYLPVWYLFFLSYTIHSIFTAITQAFVLRTDLLESSKFQISIFLISPIIWIWWWVIVFLTPPNKSLCLVWITWQATFFCGAEKVMHEIGCFFYG